MNMLAQQDHIYIYNITHENACKSKYVKLVLKLNDKHAKLEKRERASKLKYKYSTFWHSM